MVAAGMRGILNLGQTCFLSVVLQTFLHNPLLRNHFLADKHNRYLCTARHTANGTKKDCMMCEMDRMYSDVRLLGRCSTWTELS